MGFILDTDNEHISVEHCRDSVVINAIYNWQTEETLTDLELELSDVPELIILLQQVMDVEHIAEQQEHRP